ncbi:MAG: tripartite tricarboxylate transporter TctB family protein [Clostridia bacterium]|nr:tripartite tricarboxylate transporter TctB family protein [Clostridia bacterium]
MLELIVNILLFLFFVYTLCFNVLEAPVPDRVQRNPFALQPNVWPSVILVLLMICVAINIYKIISKNKGKPEFTLKAFGASISSFLKSRLFIGIAIVVILSFLLESLGFMVSCFLFLISYGILLGERKIWRLVLICLIITLVLYICFGVLLAVNLPRGTIPALRNFALFVESLIP